MPSLEIKLLGGFEARLKGGPSLDLPTKKTQALLAYLAVRPGEFRTREKIADLLWSDRGDAQAKASLRQALTALRKALQGRDPDPLSIEGERLALDPSAVEVDVERFERLVEEGSTGSLETAASLYRGDLLDGLDARDPVFDEWLTVERERLRELAINGMSQLLDKQTSADQPERAIDTAKRVLTLDPLHEASHRALMGLYAAQGERSHAIRQYKTCCDLLKEQLGVEPEAETRALHDAIREGQTPKASEEAPVGGPRVTPVGNDSLPLPDKPSIAVLPFKNLSADATQEYFVDGLTEEIISRLSRFRHLFVIASHSVFIYKDKPAKVQDVARELGVRYVVEGSMRAGGGRLRVSARLIDAGTGHHVWAESFDHDAKDPLAVQDMVSEAVVAAVGTYDIGSLTRAEINRVSRKSPGSLQAHECIALALDYQGRFTPEDFAKSNELLDRAITLDPRNATAYAIAAYNCILEWWFGWVDPSKNYDKRAFELTRKAIALDPSDQWGHWSLGAAYLYITQQHAKAITKFEEALAINPNSSDIHADYGYALAFVGRSHEGIEEVEKGMRLNPRHADWYEWSLGVAQYTARRYEDAVRTLERIENHHLDTCSFLAASYAQLGRKERAEAQANEILKLKPDYTARWWADRSPYGDPKDREHFFEGLRKAGLPE